MKQGDSFEMARPKSNLIDLETYRKQVKNLLEMQEELVRLLKNARDFFSRESLEKVCSYYEKMRDSLIKYDDFYLEICAQKPNKKQRRLIEALNNKLTRKKVLKGGSVTKTIGEISGCIIDLQDMIEEIVKRDQRLEQLSKEDGIPIIDRNYERNDTEELYERIKSLIDYTTKIEGELEEQRKDLAKAIFRIHGILESMRNQRQKKEKFNINENAQIKAIDLRIEQKKDSELDQKKLLGLLSETNTWNSFSNPDIEMSSNNYSEEYVFDEGEGRRANDIKFESFMQHITQVINLENQKPAEGLKKQNEDSRYIKMSVQIESEEPDEETPKKLFESLKKRSEIVKSNQITNDPLNLNLDSWNDKADKGIPGHDDKHKQPDKDNPTKNNPNNNLNRE